MSKVRRGHKTNNAFIITVSSHTKHLVGSDAGSSKELDEKGAALAINRRRRKSELNFKKAQKALHCLNLDKARKYMEDALKYGAKAYWWSETTPHQEELHEYIHRISKWNHDNLGCFIEFESGQYVQRCMIAYSHKRIGVSPGMYGDKVCSLCDGDLSTCPHRKSRTYWIRGGSRNERGGCRICLQKKCDHDSKFLYRTRVSGRLENPVLTEVSLVKYPVQPEMRMVSEFTYSIQEIMRLSKYRLKVGDRIPCHACSGKCPGFDELNH